MYSPAMDFNWFREHVSRLTRQTLTTMGKHIGVKPYRRKGQWCFRTSSGDDRTLQEVFAALQANPRGRQWLEDAYSYPIRSAEAQRQRDEEHQQAKQAELVAAFDFLTREFDYSPPFLLPVRVGEVVIVAFRHERAARQVEISKSGYQTHCEIRRLINGVPGEYKADSIADWELRMMRRWFGDDKILVDGDLILQRAVKTLRAAATILRGEEWIDRARIDRKYQREFVGKFGGPFPTGPGLLDIARERASFLVKDHGFVLEFDSSTRSPHEHEMWERLRYRRGDSTIELCNTDIRVPGEWVVKMNGATIIQTWDDFEKALTEGLAEVARRLTRI